MNGTNSYFVGLPLSKDELDNAIERAMRVNDSFFREYYSIIREMDVTIRISPSNDGIYVVSKVIDGDLKNE